MFSSQQCWFLVGFFSTLRVPTEHLRRWHPQKESSFPRINFQVLWKYIFFYWLNCLTARSQRFRPKAQWSIQEPGQGNWMLNWIWIAGYSPNCHGVFKPFQPTFLKPPHNCQLRTSSHFTGPTNDVHPWESHLGISLLPFLPFFLGSNNKYHQIFTTVKLNCKGSHHSLKRLLKAAPWRIQWDERYYVPTFVRHLSQR